MTTQQKPPICGIKTDECLECGAKVGQKNLNKDGICGLCIQEVNESLD